MSTSTEITAEQMTLQIIKYICLTTAFIALCITGGCTYTRHAAFKNGYEERMLPGSPNSQWVKASRKEGK